MPQGLSPAAVRLWWLVELMWLDKVELIPHQRKGNYDAVCMPTGEQMVPDLVIQAGTRSTQHYANLTQYARIIAHDWGETVTVIVHGPVIGKPMSARWITATSAWDGNPPPYAERIIAHYHLGSRASGHRRFNGQLIREPCGVWSSAG